MISSTVVLDGEAADVKLRGVKAKQPLMYGEMVSSTSLVPAKDHQALAYADYLVRSKYVQKELDHDHGVETALGLHDVSDRLLAIVQTRSDKKNVSVRRLGGQPVTVLGTTVTITSRHTFTYKMGVRKFTVSQTPTPYLLKFTRDNGTTFYIGPKSAFEKASTTKTAKVKRRSAKTAKGTSTKMTDAELKKLIEVQVHSGADMEPEWEKGILTALQDGRTTVDDIHRVVTDPDDNLGGRWLIPRLRLFQKKHPEYPIEPKTVHPSHAAHPRFVGLEDHPQHPSHAPATSAPPPAPPPALPTQASQIINQAQTIPACIAYKKMLDCYRDAYRPPFWTLAKCVDLLSMYGSSAVALYPAGADLETIKRLVSMREPTNIANPTPNQSAKQYDAQALREAFGYWEGLYRELSQDGTVLPPQVAVACTTPIVADPGKVRMSSEEGPHKVVNVVSIIGLAFDSALQPDRTYFTDADGNLRRERLHKAMTQAYLLAFEATAAMKKSILVPAPIGDMAFRPQKEYPDYDVTAQERFIDDFVKPAIANAHEKFSTMYERVLPKIDVEPLARFKMPLKQSSTGEMAKTTFTVPECFFMPDGGIYNLSQSELSKRVFVNAWDCWSMLGNGNFSDRSADGYWGRSTAIALLGWPTSNPRLRYVEAPTPDEDAPSAATASAADAGEEYLRASFKMAGKHVVLDGDGVLRLHAQLDPNDTSVQSQFFVKPLTGTGMDGTLLYTSPGKRLAVTAPKLHGKKPLNVQPKSRSDGAKGSVHVRLMPMMTSLLQSAGVVSSGALRADGYTPAAYLDPYNDDDDLFWWFGDKTTDGPKPKQVCTVSLTEEHQAESAAAESDPIRLQCVLKRGEHYLAIDSDGQLVLRKERFGFFYEPNAKDGSLLYVGKPQHTKPLMVTPPPHLEVVKTSTSKKAVHVRLRSTDGGEYALQAVHDGPARYLDQYYSDAPGLYWYHGDKTSNAPKPNQKFTLGRN